MSSNCAELSVWRHHLSQPISNTPVLHVGRERMTPMDKCSIFDLEKGNTKASNLGSTQGLQIRRSGHSRTQSNIRDRYWRHLETKIWLECIHSTWRQMSANRAKLQVWTYHSSQKFGNTTEQGMAGEPKNWNEATYSNLTPQAVLLGHLGLKPSQP